MPSFGEKLKKERDKRKITLEEISASTKISTRMLQALEADKFSQLPGGIFNKGFVRAYARVVGLDEEQTVADYMQASGDAPPAATEIAPRADETRAHQENVGWLEASSPARQLPWGWFAAALLIIALILSLWSHRERLLHPSRPSPVEQPAKPTNETSSRPGENRGDGSPATASALSAPPSSLSATASKSSSSGPAPTTAPGKLPSAAVVPAPGPGEFSVDIHAREDSWTSVTADGRTSSELLVAGGDRAVRGRKEIIIRVGNAGGVDLRFNGKKLGVVGQYGEVKTLAFGPGGMIATVPAPAPTP